jgi:hypothetical protein
MVQLPSALPRPALMCNLYLCISYWCVCPAHPQQGGAWQQQLASLYLSI